MSEWSVRADFALEGAEVGDELASRIVKGLRAYHGILSARPDELAVRVVVELPEESGPGDAVDKALGVIETQLSEAGLSSHPLLRVEMFLGGLPHPASRPPAGRENHQQTESERARYASLGRRFSAFWDEDEVGPVLRLQGDLDADSAPALEMALSDEVASTGPPIVVDLADVTFIASACLRALATMAVRSAETGRPVHLANANDRVTRILRLAGLDLMLPTFGSVEDAHAEAVSSDR